MWKIKKISHQSGLELMTTRMIDEVLANGTTEAVFNCLLISFLGLSQAISNLLCTSGVLGARSYVVPINVRTSSVSVHFVHDIGGTDCFRWEHLPFYRYSQGFLLPILSFSEFPAKLRHLVHGLFSIIYLV